MLESFLITKLSCDVPARREVIGQDGAITEDPVERFKNLSCNADERAKQGRVVRCMYQKMIFDLRDDFRRVNDRANVENISNSNFEVSLLIEREYIFGAGCEQDEPDIQPDSVSQGPRAMPKVRRPLSKL
jgi:hypothetical protein